MLANGKNGGVSKRDGLIALGLLALTCAVYIPAMNAGWIWDDGVMVHASGLIKSNGGLYKFWFTTQALDYFPLTHTLLWLQWRLWGDNPAGYHVVNIVLHGLCAVVLWRVLVRLKLPGALAAAAIFAVHPVGVASAAWISETKNTLSLLLAAAAALAYLRFEDQPSHKALYRWSQLLFLLALLAKSSVVMLPVTLLVLAWWRRGRVNRNDLLRVAPMLVMSLVLGLVTIYFQHHNALPDHMAPPASWLARLAGAGWCVWFYLYKAFAPLHTAMIYPRWSIDVGNPLHWLPLAALAAAPFIARRYSRSTLLALGLIVLLLLPVLGLITMAYHAHALVADHFQYPALIVPIAWACAAAARHITSRRAGAAVAVVVVLLCSGLSWSRAVRFADAEVLWLHTIAHNDRAWAAHNNLGTLLLHDRKLDEAAAHFRRVIDLRPNYAVGHFNLGNTLRQQKNLEAAADRYQRALELRPDYLKAHTNMGLLLLRLRRVEQAVAHLERVVERQPKNGPIRNTLGNALSLLGRHEEALPHLEQAALLNFFNIPARLDLADTLAAMGRFDEALEQLERALEVASPRDRRTIRRSIDAYRFALPE